MNIKRLALVATGAAAILTAGIGTASAISTNGAYIKDTVSVGGCTANRWESSPSLGHQYTWIEVTGWGGGNISCGFALGQSFNSSCANAAWYWYPSGPGSSSSNPLYDGPGNWDQLYVQAFNNATNQSQSATGVCY